MSTMVETAVFCDYCKKLILGEQTKVFTLVTGHIGQGTDLHECTINISVKGVFPYISGDTDICNSCVQKFLKQASERK